MKTSGLKWHLTIRVAVLIITLTVAALLLSKEKYPYFFVILPLIVFLIIDFYNFQVKVLKDLGEFVQSIQYRDFSRNFDVNKAPSWLKPVRSGFNEINNTIKGIARERETQYQYLSKVLEMVNTGILSYSADTGQVVWMNDAAKEILQVPHLKFISYLSKKQKNLYEEISSLDPGVSKIFEIKAEKSSFKILISATVFYTDGKRFKLIAFQNVNEALEETESIAWQRLLSVLTHEIMNSIAPISSLADTLKVLVNDLDDNQEQDTVEDLSIGIETIKRRSEGLLKFAQTYRNLNKITKLNLRQVIVADLFKNLFQLMQPTLLQKNIQLNIVLKDPSINLQADAELLEQILINLILNAIDAIKERIEPQIIMSAEVSSKGRVAIKVIDNGSGISDEVLDKIFIPFFTSKKNGSGIGLTLCKQIMRLHKGNIQVNSRVGEGTAFTLEF